MSICVCVNWTIDIDLTWCLMEAVSGQTGITVSCIQHIIQVIVFIHSWLVSMVTDERESHMLHHDIWLLWTFL